MPPGGLDLSDTKDKIEFRGADDKPSLPKPLPENGFPLLPSFQGFQFQIIGFQPITNPAAFLLTLFPDQGKEAKTSSQLRDQEVLGRENDAVLSQNRF